MATGRITVVGAGIVGLTTAVRLAEAGYEVDVFARDLPLETTSAVAAALWYPYRAQPPHLVGRWAAASLEVYLQEAGGPGSPVRMVDGLELRAGPSTPWFVDVLPDDVAFSHYTTLPDRYGDGWQMRLPVIEPGLYLRGLVVRLQRAGATLTRMPLTALPDRGIVVNCTGLAARSLVSDGDVTPVQGQVVRVAPIPGVDTWLLDQTDDANLVYVIPRGHDIVVGGTALVNSYDRRPDPDVTKSILQRASRLVPQLAKATVLGSATGLRPERSKVRVELERGANGSAVIHNYGHGGSGWTLAWGCADTVLEHVETFTATKRYVPRDDERAQRAMQGRAHDHLSLARRLLERGGQPPTRPGF
jgi:D-amino-acid oxidase